MKICPVEAELFHADRRTDIIIIMGIQPLGRFGQRPELSQSTGIALVRCILGKFLGVVCHCFPPDRHNEDNCHFSQFCERGHKTAVQIRLNVLHTFCWLLWQNQ